MRERMALSEMIGAGVRFDADEAVAVAQQLIASDRAEGAIARSLDPPSLDTVLIDRNGLVECHACATPPSVLGVGKLLQAMLPSDGSTRVPGALRYAIARALMEVLAPPFASIAEFGEALKRFERADRPTVLRELFARAARNDRRLVALASSVDSPERRHRGPSVTELRRQLREADRALYLLRVERAAAVSSPDPAQTHLLETGDVAGEWVLDRATDADSAAVGSARIDRVRRGRRRAAAVGAVAVTLAFGIGYVGVAQVGWASTRTPARLSVWSDVVADWVSSSASAIKGVVAGDGDAAAPDRTAVPNDPSIVRALSRSAGTVFSPSFARTGSTLFFHTGQADDESSALKAADLSGADAQIVAIIDDGARNYHVQPSPAGDRIAFDSDRDGERGVYVANRDGSGIQRVSGSGYAAVPTWSTDGGRLAFIRAEPDRPRVWNLHLLVLESADIRRLTNFQFGQTWGASWFPDGRRICYAHEDRLYVRDLVSGVVREIEAPVAGRQVRTPAVSPDGNRVIFQVVQSGAWMLDVGQGTMAKVLDDPTAEEFAWAPNGRVAFHSRRDGQWSVWLMIPM